MNVLFMRCRSKKNPERSGFFFIFSKNLDSGACQVKNLKREKLSDFLGLTDIFSVKNRIKKRRTSRQDCPDGRRLMIILPCG